MCAHPGSGLWAVGTWRTSGHCRLEWDWREEAAKALRGPRGEGEAGGLGRREGTTDAWCTSDSSIPPSVSSLVSVPRLTLAWWVILHPFSQPQTFHLTQVRGLRSTQVASTLLPLVGPSMADRPSQPQVVRAVAEPTSCFHSLWKVLEKHTNKRVKTQLGRGTGVTFRRGI